jgi:membrane protein implicated in regulation of membrane protease activity
MPWWGWFALGAALLGAELMVATDFWLATIGAAAMVMGLVLTLVEPPLVWIEWIEFAVLAVAFNALFRRRLNERWLGKPPGLEPELVGESGVAVAEIAPGAQGSVELRGSTWQARNVGSETLAARAPVRVTGVRGIVLEVRG